MSEEKSYLWSKIKKNNLGSVKELKDKSLAKEIGQLIAYKGTIIQSKTNDAEFMIRNGTGNDESLHSKSLYLSVVDIEGGGPQPRTRITPDDPETVKLFHNLKERYKLYGNIEKAQLVPIQVYRSPTTPGKYRIFDGHRRTMVIFTMLMLPEIKAECVNITEEEAFENAFEIHLRANLTAYDQGHYILEELMKRFPAKYPTQDSVGEQLRVSQDSISLFVRAYREIESQKTKSNLSQEVTNRFVEMPASKIVPIAQAPEELKPAIINSVVENDLSQREIKALVKEVSADPEATSTSVAEVAKRLANEKAERYMKDAEKIVAKTERSRDKVVEVGADYPEALMKAVFGHLGLKSNGKVAPEKAKAYAKTLVSIWYQDSVDNKKLDADLLKADLWA